jgi:hypothetical protein
MYSFALSSVFWIFVSALGSAVDPFRSMRGVHVVFLRVDDSAYDAASSGITVFPTDCKKCGGPLGSSAARREVMSMPA